MNSITEAEGVDDASNRKLGLRVLRMDGAHDAGTCLGIDMVHGIPIVVRGFGVRAGRRFALQMPNRRVR